MEELLRVLFIGAGAVNFGGAEGPWDHSRRLEKLGGVEVVAIADPDLKKARAVLQKKLSESMHTCTRTVWWRQTTRWPLIRPSLKLLL